MRSIARSSWIPLAACLAACAGGQEAAAPGERTRSGHPEHSALRIVPESPGVLHQLSVASDDALWASLGAGRKGGRTEFTWFVQGRPVGSGRVLDPGNFERGDEVVVARTFVDGAGRPREGGRARTTIANTPPRIRSVRVERDALRPSTLRAIAEFDDADGDALSVQRRWRVDDRATMVDRETFDLSSLARGARVEMEVRVDDGFDSATAAAPVFVLDNHPPELEVGAPARIEDPQRGAMLRLPLTTRDPDGDPLRVALIESPSGSRIGGEGEWLWMPDDGRAATALLRVEDDHGGSLERRVTVPAR